MLPLCSWWGWRLPFCQVLWRFSSYTCTPGFSLGLLGWLASLCWQPLSVLHSYTQLSPRPSEGCQHNRGVRGAKITCYDSVSSFLIDTIILISFVLGRLNKLIHVIHLKHAWSIVSTVYFRAYHCHWIPKRHLRFNTSKQNSNFCHLQSHSVIQQTFAEQLFNAGLGFCLPRANVPRAYCRSVNTECSFGLPHVRQEPHQLCFQALWSGTWLTLPPHLMHNLVPWSCCSYTGLLSGPEDAGLFLDFQLTALSAWNALFQDLFMDGPILPSRVLSLYLHFKETARPIQCAQNPPSVLFGSSSCLLSL